MNRTYHDISYFIAIGMGLIALFAIMLFAQTCWADVDMDIIAEIESSGDPLAYNSRTKATGKWQITPICLADFRIYNNTQYTLKDMFNQGNCYEVAFWYLNKRIPQMLRYYECPVTVDNILICYNWGIGHLVNGDKLPKETEDYIMRCKERGPV